MQLDDACSLSIIHRQENDDGDFNESSSEEDTSEKPHFYREKNRDKMLIKDQAEHLGLEDSDREDNKSKPIKFKKRYKLKGISDFAGHNDEESERLTFGCATPP